MKMKTSMKTSMKTKAIGYLLGAASLLMAGQANAAVISLTPAVNNVSVGDTFTLTIAGTDFIGGTIGGGVALSWDVNQVNLLSDLTAINASLTGEGWITGNMDPAVSIVFGVGSVSIDVVDFGIAPANFNIASLDFLVVPTAVSGPIDIAASALSAGTGGWEGRLVDYNPAQINVNAVPVPAAVWLFGSGLIGLVGVARRRKLAQA